MIEWIGVIAVLAFFAVHFYLACTDENYWMPEEDE